MRGEPETPVLGFQDAIHRIVAQAILLRDVGQGGSIKAIGTSIGPKPHPSLAVLHDAMHDPGAGHALCRVRLGFGERKRRELRAVKATDALQRTDPDDSLAVDDDVPDIVIDQAILLGEVDERLPVILGDAAFGAEPNISILVLDDSPDCEPDEAFLDRERVKRLPVVADHAIAVGPEPEISTVILEDPADELAQLFVLDGGGFNARVLGSCRLLLQRGGGYIGPDHHGQAESKRQRWCFHRE